MPASNHWKAYNARFQMGAESTEGNAVTPTVFQQVYSVSGSRTWVEERIKSNRRVGGGKRHPTVRLKRGGKCRVKGQLTYQNYGMAIFGAVGAGTTDGTGPPYDHTGTSGTGEVSLRSFTVQVFPTGDLAECVRLEGAKIESLTISGSKNAVVEIEWSMRSMTSTDFASGTAETAPTNQTLVTADHASISWGGTAHSDVIESFKFMIASDLVDIDTIGQNYPRSIISGHERSFTLEATLILDDTYTRALQDDRDANTARALVLSFTDGAEVLTFTMFNATIVEDIEYSSEGAGLIKATVKFEAVSTSAGTAICTVAYTTVTTTYDGNG